MFFKATALQIPDPVIHDQKAMPYDFSPPTFESLSAISHLVGGNKAPQLQVSHERPAYFDHIQSDPTYIVDFDPRELEAASRLGP